MFEGASIGQYRVVRKIGEGGMGAVFLAEHTLIGRRAAIKVLLPELSQRREIVDRFFNEARATTSISDPGIVQVFDFGFHSDNSAYIVMEFLEGESLDGRLKRLGIMPVAEALRITRQAAGSLAAAHARNIVHRDLKPDNIFIVRDPEAMGGERPKILDFGIAKLAADETNRMRTRTGMVMGTPVYMSPEQCRGAGKVDHRSDIYSLGCVLYHLIAGRPPFDYEGMGEIFSAHMNEPPPSVTNFVQGVPLGVDELLQRALAKSADQRFQTMQELQSACDALLSRLTAAGATSQTIALATPLSPGFRSVTPGGTSAPITQPGSTPTTLSAAVGQHTGAATSGGKRNLGLLAGIGLLAIGGAIALVVATRGGSSEDAGPKAASPTEVTPAVKSPEVTPSEAKPPESPV
ncbi:MAG TPA: serine/threonine-protein kinase, partial [Kofleriaceae bacterium]